MIWWRRGEAGFCCRAFGFGVCVVDHRLQAPLFSERTLGIRSYPFFHVGPWHVGVLYPFWLQETLMNPLGICFRGLRPVRRVGEYGQAIGFFATPRVKRWRDFWQRRGVAVNGPRKP